MSENWDCPFPHGKVYFANPYEYTSGYTAEFEPVTADNVQAILQQAIWEFDLLAGNDAYSDYCLGDWRLNFWALQEYVAEHIDELPPWASTYFLTLHDKAADILYERLEIE
jgi:hypothetical protein